MSGWTNLESINKMGMVCSWYTHHVMMVRWLHHESCCTTSLHGYSHVVPSCCWPGYGEIPSAEASHPASSRGNSMEFGQKTWSFPFSALCHILLFRGCFFGLVPGCISCVMLCSFVFNFGACSICLVCLHIVLSFALFLGLLAFLICLSSLAFCCSSLLGKSLHSGFQRNFSPLYMPSPEDQRLMTG